MMPAQYRDLMIDLETMGTGPRGAIISIGAVFFDLATGKSWGTFEMPISLESSQLIGMEIHAKTVQWWLKQSPEAIEQWNTPRAVGIETALSEFIGWYGRNTRGERSTRVWANAPTFDLAIMRSAFDLADMSTPWHWRQERCVRTLVSMAKDLGANPRSEPREGTAHKAIDDCMHQIRYCHLAWRALQTVGGSKS